MLKFLKKNGYYIMLGVCVLCIATMIIVSVNASNRISELSKPKPTLSPLPTASPLPLPTASPKPNPSSKPADIGANSFALPVANATIGQDFVIDTFVFSETLNQWQVHTGVDFLTDEPTTVTAVYDGTVESVTTDDILSGGKVVIAHGNGLQSVYMSLGQDILVSVGDKVEKGDALGVTSASAYSEFKSGPHLHFELLLNGEQIDPNFYFGTNK